MHTSGKKEKRVQFSVADEESCAMFMWMSGCVTEFRKNYSTVRRCMHFVTFSLQQFFFVVKASKVSSNGEHETTLYSHHDHRPCD